VTVLLQDRAGEGLAADDEYLLVVLFQLLHQRDEVAVATYDDVGVDVLMGERHLEGVKGEIDVGAILVATRRDVALDHPDGVLGQRAAMFSRALPVPVGDLRDHLSAFLDGFQNRSDVEMPSERGLHADLDVVEVYKDGNLQTWVGHCGVL
jgi:hypothetical protein